jgi:trehalose-6-phosphate synthase
LPCVRRFKVIRGSGSDGAARWLPPRPRIVDSGHVQYALMDLTQRDRQEYYNGFANRALWPTMHYRVGLSDFSRADAHESLQWFVRPRTAVKSCM